MEDVLSIDSILQSANFLWEKGDLEGALELLKMAYRKSRSNVSIAFEYGHIVSAPDFDTDSEGYACEEY